MCALCASCVCSVCRWYRCECVWSDGIGVSVCALCAGGIGVSVCGQMV